MSSEIRLMLDSDVPGMATGMIMGTRHYRWAPVKLYGIFQLLKKIA